MFCEKCGASLADDARFCPKCGAAQRAQTASRLVCPACGAALTPDSVFCEACGHRVSLGSGAQAARTTPPAPVRSQPAPNAAPAKPQPAKKKKKAHPLLALLILILIAGYAVYRDVGGCREWIPWFTKAVDDTVAAGQSLLQKITAK